MASIPYLISALASLKCLSYAEKPVMVFPPDHKDGDEKRSSKKAPSSDDKASELPKAESMEVDVPKAELNGTREDIQSEGDTQSN